MPKYIPCPICNDNGRTSEVCRCSELPVDNIVSSTEQHLDEFRKEIENTINKFCMENESNTPDFILAEYLMDCLEAFDKATEKRTKWYG